MNEPRAFGSGRCFLLLLACVTLVSAGCAVNFTSNNNSGPCDAVGEGNSASCTSVQAGVPAGTTGAAASVSSAGTQGGGSTAQDGGSADDPLPSPTAPGSVPAVSTSVLPESLRPATMAPNLYIYTGRGTLAALQVNSTSESGTSPAEISVPGGVIEDKYGSQIPQPTGCGSINNSFPGWWVPYAVSSPSRYAGLGCALFQSKTASTIANVDVSKWVELAAPYTGSYVSQCLTYVTFSPNGSNPVGAYENVTLYWTGAVWEDVPNTNAAEYADCN
jgi:hypothetical protein